MSLLVVVIFDLEIVCGDWWTIVPQSSIWPVGSWHQNDNYVDIEEEFLYFLTTTPPLIYEMWLLFMKEYNTEIDAVRHLVIEKSNQTEKSIYLCRLLVKLSEFQIYSKRPDFSLIDWAQT